jgi:hypothetical protein
MRNYTTSAEFLPQIQEQLNDETALRDDAESRGWDSEVDRHARVIAGLQHHLDAGPDYLQFHASSSGRTVPKFPPATTTSAALEIRGVSRSPRAG